MARLVLLPSVAEDFEPIRTHLQRHESPAVEQRVEAIVAALDVLTDNPEIGHGMEGEMRELVIGRGSTGYIAQYRYVAPMDTVFVLAIRAQREAGYGRDAEDAP